MLPLFLSPIRMLMGEGAAELSDRRRGNALKEGTGGGGCLEGGGREPENSIHSLKCDIRLSRPSFVIVSNMRNSFRMIATWRALS